ncbi:MAG: hypothetical protein GX999_04460 [Bacteroidales bacterium]|nr:hypothetical protein [Bacteroidales bacterium]
MTDIRIRVNKKYLDFLFRFILKNISTQKLSLSKIILNTDVPKEISILSIFVSNDDHESWR